MSKRDKRNKERGPLTPRRRPPDAVPLPMPADQFDPWAELAEAIQSADPTAEFMASLKPGQTWGVFRDGKMVTLGGEGAEKPDEKR